MIDPVQFTALKRTLALRQLTKLPDEALGELLQVLHDLLEDYGSLDTESFDNTISRRGIVSLAQMRAILEQADQRFGIAREGKPIAAVEAHDPEETQEATQILPDIFEDDVEEVTRPVHRPPAIATREAFMEWLQQKV
jgi:hypothetical protein